VAEKLRGGSPAALLLDYYGPVDRFHNDQEDAALGDFGMPTRVTTEELLEPYAKAGPRSRLGPLEKVHLFWFKGMSCDGCAVATTGATSPAIETLLLGAHPGLPRIVLHNTIINMESGPRYTKEHELAVKGRLDAPYLVVLEGSATDELKVAERGGHWAAEGEQPWGPGGEMRSVTIEEWIARMADNAAASIAIGTCATWGGIPSAEGNPTGAMSLMDFLGREYRSSYGLPVVNVPGCPPIGDNFTEAVAAIAYFLQGFGPLPEFDELGRPAWQFGETVHRHCVRGAYYEEGTYAEEFGDPECLVEIGCWGPVVNCNITSRGFIDHVGGCMNTGGACIGCTMPGFPDKFTPFYQMPPGSTVSTMGSRLLGSIVRPMRRYTMEDLNRETRWDLHDEVPSGWAVAKTEPGFFREAGHKLYNRYRRRTDRGKQQAEVWGKRPEFTERKRPEDDELAFSAERGAEGPPD
jgi:hydrogenase small subunit